MENKRIIQGQTAVDSLFIELEKEQMLKTPTNEDKLADLEKRLEILEKIVNTILSNNDSF